MLDPATGEVNAGRGAYRGVKSTFPSSRRTKVSISRIACATSLMLISSLGECM